MGRCGTGCDSGGGNILLGADVEFDVEDVGMNAPPSFPGEEFQPLAEEEADELSEGGFSSLS